MNIWFASGNNDKKKELSAILAGAIYDNAIFGKEIKSPADAGLEFGPEETGNSFCENALLKARELLRQLSSCACGVYKKGDLIIADDSGLCVDALEGRPGIYSAMYAGSADPAGAVAAASGKKLTSPQRNALLLDELGANPLRTARFVCAMVLMVSEDRFYIAHETLEGEIVKSPEYAGGTGGFGYDPIFFIPQFGRTAAELLDNEKNLVSHRGKAGKVIAGILREMRAACQSST